MGFLPYKTTKEHNHLNVLLNKSKGIVVKFNCRQKYYSGVGSEKISYSGCLFFSKKLLNTSLKGFPLDSMKRNKW